MWLKRGALALSCAAAAAPGVQAAPPDAVVLPGQGAGFIRVDFVDTSITYELTNLTGTDIFSTTTQSARFEVLAPILTTVTVEFPTWQPDPPAPQGVRQAAFSDGSHRIGGRLYLDPTPDDPANGDTIFQSDNGVLWADGRRGMVTWGLGADISAGITDHPTGIAEAGVYSLDATVTIQAR